MSWHHLPSKNPVARKEHQCSLCLTMIDKGEKYHVHSGFFDGYFQSTKLHEWCNDLTRKLTADWDDMSWETCQICDAFDEWVHKNYKEWGINEEMHILNLVESLKKWRERADDRRSAMTERAIRAQLENYTGKLIDREEILKKVQS